MRVFLLLAVALMCIVVTMAEGEACTDEHFCHDKCPTNADGHHVTGHCVGDKCECTDHGHNNPHPGHEVHHNGH